MGGVGVGGWGGVPEKLGIVLLFKKDLEESRYRQYLNPSQNTSTAPAPQKYPNWAGFLLKNLAQVEVVWVVYSDTRII